MKVKQKGKVYPSSSSWKDAQSVLNLLPVTILALASALPSNDQEVVAYMLMRSIVIIANSSSPHQSKTNCKKRRPVSSHNHQKNIRKVPLFDCGCFDCYTSFWYRWDSSPNRELIHQAIEAFEEHLTKNEYPKKHSRGRNRGKQVGKSDISGNVYGKVSAMPDNFLPEAGTPVMRVSECGEEETGNLGKPGVVVVVVEEEREVEKATEMVTVQAPVSYHKGLARKVLPDVVGLLNSRLWSLWNPSI